MTLLLSCFLLAVLALASIKVSSDKNTGTGDSFKGPVGLQLYSLRDAFSKDVPGTLAKVRDYGIKYVELAGTYKYTSAEFKQQLDNHGLEAVAGHFPFERVRDEVDKVAAEAKDLGLKYVGVAWIPHKASFTEDAARQAAAVFNKSGEALSKQGLKLFYHNHGYEFQPHGNGTLLDLLMAETNPDFLEWEMDVFWTVYPAQDPAALLKKYPNRWTLMHLKDMKKGVQTGSLTGQADVGYDVILGTGQMQMPAILKAAKEIGVKYYFIEDESPSAATQIPQSLKFLEDVKF